MEKIEETIKEIAIKHGVAVGHDDPIMILHTINERLMKETAATQRQILREFKEELESAAHKWEVTTKKTAERILDVACPFGKPAYLADIVCAMMWRDCFAPDLTQQAGTQPFSL